MILYCDGYFKLTEDNKSEREKRAKRFFRMSLRLPLELNMLIARRVYLGKASLILSHQTEAALSRVLSGCLSFSP